MRRFDPRKKRKRKENSLKYMADHSNFVAFRDAAAELRGWMDYA
jgi:hypothetical protein